MVVATDEDPQDPFSLFIAEEVLNRHDRQLPTPSTHHALRIAAPTTTATRSLILAFGLGLAGGAAPLWWQSALGSPYSSVSIADAGPEASAETASTRPHGTTGGTAATLAGDRELPPDPVAAVSEATSRSTNAAPVRRRTAPAAASVRTVRYSGEKRAPFRGSLAVTTTPSGAQVSLDGTPLGPTPVRVVNVPAGSHVLRVEAQGRRASASAIQVVANRTTRVTRALEAAP